MAPYSIALGGGDRLAQLFSFPNRPGSTETLADTVLHWFGQTLANDGIAARASVEVSATNDYTLTLDGPDALAPAFALYGVRLPKFLENGWDALTTVVPAITKDGKWDPSPDSPPPPYRPWRFFLPLGMAMLNQRSVQFFPLPTNPAPGTDAQLSRRSGSGAMLRNARGQRRRVERASVVQRGC